METTTQFIAILVTVAGLLGWLLKQVIAYFIGSSNEKTAYIERLVSSNQTNTENFVNTINHQRTLDREMQGKLNESLMDLRSEICNTNKINEKVFNIIFDKKEK